MWIVPALGAAACFGGLHYLLEDDSQKTITLASGGAARILTLAGAIAALFLLLTGKPLVVNRRRFRKDILAAAALAAGLALTAYVVSTTGAVASGVMINATLVIVLGLEAMYDEVKLDWPTLLSIFGLMVMTQQSAFYFEKANP